MKLVYPHWQHGRLIEGEIPGMEQPLPILTIFLNLGVTERVIMEGILYGQLSIEVMRAAPVIRYILVWRDDDTAYYNVAKRWRD